MTTEEFGFVLILARLLIHLAALVVTYIRARMSRKALECIVERLQNIRTEIGKIKISCQSVERHHQPDKDLESQESSPTKPAAENTFAIRYAPSRNPIGTLAASLILAGVGTLIALHFISGAFHGKTYETQIAQQQAITLPDNSVILLNGGSKLSVNYTDTERRATLERGEARFTVSSQDTRPFVVGARQAIIRASGDTFNVRLGADDGRAFITAIKGVVRVIAKMTSASLTHPPQISDYTLMAPGGTRHSRQSYRAAVTADGRVLIDSGPSINRVRGWPEHRLVFEEETLQEIVNEFNRYYPTQVRIVDPELAQCRMSISLLSYGRQDLFDYLHTFIGVQVIRDDSGNYSLRSGDLSAPGANRCFSKKVKNYN